MLASIAIGGFALAWTDLTHAYEPNVPPHPFWGRMQVARPEGEGISVLVLRAHDAVERCDERAFAETVKQAASRIDARQLPYIGFLRKQLKNCAKLKFKDYVFADEQEVEAAKAIEKEATEAKCKQTAYQKSRKNALALSKARNDAAQQEERNARTLRSEAEDLRAQAEAASREADTLVTSDPARASELKRKAKELKDDADLRRVEAKSAERNARGLKNNAEVWELIADDYNSELVTQAPCKGKGFTVPKDDGK